MSEDETVDHMSDDKTTEDPTQDDSSPVSGDSDAKFVVDEEWKDRVQAEKEAAAAETEAKRAEAEAAKLPPASFELLISSLATQVMFALGLFPDPRTEKATVQLDLAKHNIDMLGILEEKTQGNRTAEETEMLTQTLHELRMLFVSVSNAPPQAGDEPKGAGGIVLP